MVPYFERHSCKQFIRNEPIRFRYKLWIIASSCGIPYKVTIYEGKEITEKSNDPFGTRVVIECLTVCESTDHRIFFDNIFKFYNLIYRHVEKEFRAIGTLRPNRTSGCPLTDAKLMKKKSRDSFEYKSCDNIEVVRWNDKNVVTFYSKCVGSEPVGKIKRWVKNEGHIYETQPAVVKLYNKGMGGVNLVDRALSDLRPSMHGKK